VWSGAAVQRNRADRAQPFGQDHGKNTLKEAAGTA
jgi:hypothetical protein